jgi:aquaporin Z
MNKYLTELIGTFFLVFTIGLSVLGGTPMAPLAIGAVLMVMIYMGGHVSGAHYNPAVSLAVLLRGKLPARDVVPYMAAQVLGAVAAAAVVYVVLGRTFAPAPGPAASAVGALLVEVLYTTALCLVVLHSATAPQTTGNSFYGLAIGFTVVAAAFAGGPISGGAFNPAVGIGPILVSAVAGDGSLANLWLYLVGPLVGGALAAAVYRVQQPVEVRQQEVLAARAGGHRRRHLETTLTQIATQHGTAARVRVPDFRPSSTWAARLTARRCLETETGRKQGWTAEGANTCMMHR